MNLLLIVNKIRVATKTQSPKGTSRGLGNYVVHKLSESLSHGDFVAELDFWSRL